MSVEELILYRWREGMKPGNIADKLKVSVAKVGQVIRLELYRQHRERTQQVSR